MTISFQYNGHVYSADVAKSIALHIPMQNGKQVNCFYAPYFQTEPFRMGNFVGSIAQGAPVNFYDVKINPHGNGTHTECVGHITDKLYNVYEYIQPYFGLAQLVSCYPQKMENGDKIISAELLKQLNIKDDVQAIIVRTLPNNNDKLMQQYSGSNPTYFTTDALEYLVQKNFTHLLVDLPSIDREEDGGKLAAHKIWWQYNQPNTRYNCSITELVYAPSAVLDGLYLLSLTFPPFGLDAAPSSVLLFEIQ